MAVTIKSFLVPHDDTNGTLVAKRIEGFAKESKMSFVHQYVVIDADAKRTGSVLSIKASTMTRGRKLKEFARKIATPYHYTLAA